MSVSLTAEQLQDIISSAVSSAVREARKPADPTPEEMAKKAAEKANREDMARMEAMKTENRRMNQLLCSHIRKNGTTPAVYVQNGNYMICQHCTGMVKPGAPTEDEIKHGSPFIYDTDLFNRLLQLHIDGKDSM